MRFKGQFIKAIDGTVSDSKLGRRPADGKFFLRFKLFEKSLAVTFVMDDFPIIFCVGQKVRVFTGHDSSHQGDGPDDPKTVSVRCMMLLDAHNNPMIAIGDDTEIHLD